MEKKVTVLIACRDGERTLPQTLESLVKQTIKPIIIVADDHSIDATPDIIKKYGAVHIKYPVRQPKDYNRVPVLFSMAYQKAPPSDYYMISGDDNVYPPNYIESLIKLMQKDQIHIASGYNKHLKYRYMRAPTGSGRIITKKFITKIMPLKGFVTWDTFMLSEASRKGYRTKVYPIPKIHLKERRTRYTWGYGAHLLNTPIIFTLCRVIYKVIITKKILFPLSIFVGQVVYTLKRIPKLEHTEYNRLLKLWRLKRMVFSLAG